MSWAALDRTEVLVSSPTKLKQKNKPRVKLEPRTPTAARLKKTVVDLEPRRPTAARLKKLV